VGSFSVTVVLFVTIILPAVDPRYSMLNIFSKNASVPVVGSWVDGDWFYTVPASGVNGSMPHVLVNYTRFWMDMVRHVRWNLWRYNGNVWVNVSNQMNIYIVNRSGGHQKFAVNFTPSNSGVHRLQLFVDWGANSFWYNDTRSEYQLEYNTGGNRWCFIYNFSDVRRINGLGFSHYVNNVGQLVFNITRNVPVGGVNRLISLDPVYGMIANAVVDSWEWDAQEGMVYSKRCLVRLNNSEFYLTSAYGDTGTDADGFLRTLKVWNNNGTIQKSIAANNSWEYDTSDGAYAGVQQFPGTDKYVVWYRDAGSSVGRIFTVRVYANNRTISKSMLDSNITLNILYGDICRLTNNIYAVSGRYTTPDFDVYNVIETFWVNSSGTINNTHRDLEYVQDVGPSAATYPHMCLVDSNTMALVFAGEGSDGYLYTYNFTTGGVLTLSDSWEFDGTYGYSPFIQPIGNNIFAIAYQSVASGKGKVCTASIANTGVITEGWVDTLEFDSNLGTLPFCFPVFNGSVYGIAYKDVDGNGQLSTVNISLNGSVGDAVIDTLEFNALDNILWANVVHVDDEFYFIVYTGTGNDGWSCTVNITTPNGEPAILNPYPGNGSAGVGLIPTCSVYVVDPEANTMTVTWQENSTGVWVTRQVNTSVASGSTVRRLFAQASVKNTRYWWRVWANDGAGKNISEVFNFRTRTSNISEITNEVPENESTGVHVLPRLFITVNDDDGDAMDVKWYEYTSPYIMRPVTDGSIKQLSASSGFNWQCTDDTTYVESILQPGKMYSNNDTDYVLENGGTWKKDLYNLTNRTTECFVIKNVTVYAVIKKTSFLEDPSFADSSFNITIKTHGRSYNSTTVTDIEAVYYEFHSSYEVNPFTGLAWTWDELDDLEAGVNLCTDKVGAFQDTGVRCSAVYVKVNPWSDADTLDLRVPFGVNNSVGNGTYSQMNSNFSEAKQTYWWYVTVDDGVEVNTSDVFHFTTEDWTIFNTSMNGVVYNISVWNVFSSSISGVVRNVTVFKVVDATKNGSFYNRSSRWIVLSSSMNGRMRNVSSWRVVDSSINGSFYNTTSIFRVVDDSINGLFYNASVYVVIDNTVNGSFYNTTIPVYHIIDDTVNGSFYNATPVFHTIDDAVDGVFFNASRFNLIDDTINGVFCNSSIFMVIDDSVNGSFMNTSRYVVIDDTINGSFYNLTVPVFHVLDDTVNGSFYNITTGFVIVDDSVNGSFMNTTGYHIVDNTINGMFSNISYYIIVDDTINGIFYNVSAGFIIIDNTINGSFYNLSMGNVSLISIYPVNGSTGVPLSVTLSITISHNKGYNMTILWWDNTGLLLGTTLNASNGTYTMPYTNASAYNTIYWWRVNVSDSYGSYVNQSQWYRTLTQGLNNNILVVLLTSIGIGRWYPYILLGSSLLLFLVMRRRKKKKANM
jgi:hypothetical protein